MSSVPSIRIRKSNDAPVRYKGDYVLYWMIAYRRATWNFSLQRAVEWALELNKPLLIMEALRCGYRWANDRLHRFALEGMAHNAGQFKKYGILYYPYVEPFRDAGKGLLETLAEKACVIITDQTQLVREGWIHNYLRMLWGKKILEWTASPRDALNVMIELNNKYALDGRDPNSYSGISWVLGRYDRAWGPERPIFGKVRYMSSESTARKVRVRDYIKEYSLL